MHFEEERKRGDAQQQGGKGMSPGFSEDGSNFIFVTAGKRILEKGRAEREEALCETKGEDYSSFYFKGEKGIWDRCH